jgi:hypothetical protein
VQAAHIAGGNAFDRAIFIKQYFSTGKAGVDFNTQRFGLFAQPAADIAERNDVVALVMKATGQYAVRNFGGAGFGKDEETIFRDWRVKRCAVFLPVGQQFGQGAWVHDCTRENVGADFCPFLDQANRKFGSFFCSNLFQPDGRGQPGRTAANNDDVEFHGFAFHVVSWFYCDVIFNTVQYGNALINPSGTSPIWNIKRSSFTSPGCLFAGAIWTPTGT